MNTQKRFDEVTELLSFAYQEDGSQGEIEELEYELDQLARKLEDDEDVARDQILERQEMEDFAQDGYFENMEACDRM